MVDFSQPAPKVVQIATIAYGFQSSGTSDREEDSIVTEALVALREDGKIFVRDIANRQAGWLELEPPQDGINVLGYHEAEPTLGAH